MCTHHHLVAFLLRFFCWLPLFCCCCWYCKKNCNYLFTTCSLYWQSASWNLCAAEQHGGTRYTVIGVDGTMKSAAWQRLNSSRKFIRYVPRLDQLFQPFFCVANCDGPGTRRSAIELHISQRFRPIRWIALLSNIWANITGYLAQRIRHDLWNGCAHALTST